MSSQRFTLFVKASRIKINILIIYKKRYSGANTFQFYRRLCLKDLEEMPNNLKLTPAFRIPEKKEIAPVYAVIVLLIYGWTVYKFNYNLPGWLGFLNFSEIFSIFAYSMVVNFFESLIFLLIILVICFFLPKNWFFDFFITRGVIFTIIVLGLMQYLAVQFESKEYYPSELIRWSPLIFILIILVVYFAGRVTAINMLIDNLADRAVIFLYLTLPISAVSIIVIMVRLFR